MRIEPRAIPRELRDLVGVVDLWRDDPVEARSEHRGEIGVARSGFPIHADVQRRTSATRRETEHSRDRGARSILLVRWHAILQVEDRDVERARRELAEAERPLDHPRTMPGHEHERTQQRLHQ